MSAKRLLTQSRTSAYSTAKVGTPSTIPGNPNRPPHTTMETSTQMADRPVLSPKILGPRMLPSNC